MVDFDREKEIREARLLMRDMYNGWVNELFTLFSKMDKHLENLQNGKNEDR